MNDYIVYFEIYGKKMRATVRAGNIDGAKQIIRNKLIFHAVKKDDGMEILRDFLPTELKGIFGL